MNYKVQVEREFQAVSMVYPLREGHTSKTLMIILITKMCTKTINLLYCNLKEIDNLETQIILHKITSNNFLINSQLQIHKYRNK